MDKTAPNNISSDNPAVVQEIKAMFAGVGIVAESTTSDRDSKANPVHIDNARDYISGPR